MRAKLQQAISDSVQHEFSIDIGVELERPAAEFGDFTTNIAMQLIGKLERKFDGGPRTIAEQIAKNLQSLEYVASVDVAGPGFLNITLTDNALLELMAQKPQQTLKNQKVLVEYSDPNPFKPLHAGHLYTTLVGDAISRLVENAGAETIRLNFGGDVGRHVGITMWAVIRELEGEDVKKLKGLPKDSLATWMGQRYVEGTRAYEDDEQAKRDIREVNKRVYALHESGDCESAFAQIYWYLRSASYDFFKKLYSELEVHEFNRFIPESEVAAPGLIAVKDNIPEVFQESDGAVVFDGESRGLHTRVFINNEGLPTYEAKDIGLSLTKWRDYQPDTSIILTDNSQTQYMQVVIAAIGEIEPQAARVTKHLTHGVVKLAGGVKMSSRKGNILSAFDILESARDAGARSGQASAEEVVLAAVKYAFMKNRIGGDIVYDPEESIALEGNSGPYLQYAHARACSILRKADYAENDNGNESVSSNLNPAERLLVRKLGMFAEAIELATAELSPHIVCTYLYELAQEFNRFYEQTKVIGSDEESFRLHLVNAYASTLKRGLELLGIHAPKQM